MERRKAIKNMGLSVGAMVASPSILSLLQSCQASEAPWVPVFYTQEEGVFVKKLMQIILPPNGDLPGAIDLNLHIFIDKYQKEVLLVDEKGPHRKSLELAKNDMLSDGNLNSLNEASEDNYVGLLKKHLSGSYADQKAMVDEIDDYLDENDDISTGLPAQIRIYKFLNDLRNLSIWAYQINERVGENIMAYKPIPADQQGCVDLQETTGGMAWSLF